MSSTVPSETVVTTPSLAQDRDHSITASTARTVFAATMVALGILGLIYGDFAVQWQRIPIAQLPGRTALAYVSAAIELLAGIGLLATGTRRIAAGVLAVFILLWAVLLKLPAVVVVPQMEATWLGLGEITVMLAGSWVLYATHADKGGNHRLTGLVGTRGIRHARWLFALSLPTIGLSHFIYLPQTLELVPAWLPFPIGWAYLTGAGNIAACLGILFGVWPRLAATLEAAMLSIITVLVWGPGLVTHAGDRMQWTAFVISAAIAGAAWVVAGSYRRE
jgi:uncharacterized membrane protein